jgi:hypothetical protein
LAKAEKETKLVDGDRLVNVGADFTQNSFVEGNLQLENLKMLISIREEAVRWLGLIDLGLGRDEAMLTAGPMQSPTNKEVALSGEEENSRLGHLKAGFRLVEG